MPALNTIEASLALRRWQEMGRPQPCPPLEDLLTAGNAREPLDPMFVDMWERQKAKGRGL